MSAVRVFECLACGSDLRFEPGVLSIHCSICEDDRPLPLRFPAEVEGEPLTGPLSVDRLEGRSRWRCSSPGCGVLVSAPSARSTCPCCTSPLIDAAEIPALMRPHGYLPFLCGEGDAKFRLESERVRLKLSPGVHRLERIYVPWFVLSYEGRADYEGRRGTEHSDEGRTWVTWENVSGRVERPFENIRACGSSSPPEELCRRLEPWDWAFCEPLHDGALGDVPVVHSTMVREELFPRILPSVGSQLEQEVIYDIGGDLQEIQSMQAERLDERYRLVLMPMWIGALAQHHTFFLINGRTGEVVMPGYEGTDPHDDEDDEPEVDALRSRESWQRVAVVLAGLATVAFILANVLLD